MRGYSDYGFDKIALSARGSSHARLFYRRAGQSFDFLSSHVLSLSLLLLLLPLLPLLPLISQLLLLPLLALLPIMPLLPLLPLLSLLLLRSLYCH